jgi:hypothetical protein
MKNSELIEALERFFLDLIGTVLPGAVLLIGLWFVFGQPTHLGVLTVSTQLDANTWVFLITGSYILGHAITSIGQNVVLKLSSSLFGFLHKIPYIKLGIPQYVQSEDQMTEIIYQSQIFKDFVKATGSNPDEIGNTKKAITRAWIMRYVRDWRSVAMTIADEHKHTVVRFTFIALLNLGMSTALLLVISIWLCLNLFPQLGWPASGATFNFWTLVILSIATLPFIERFYQFHDRALRVPFPMALAKLRQAEASRNSTVKSNDQNVLAEGFATKNPSPIRVYLAGGFRSGWQNTLLSEFPTLIFSDPRIHALEDEGEYTTWDLEAIRRSDWVFAYLEATNPAGYSLALEVGYAKALGKHIFLVDEKSTTDEGQRRYLGMVRACSDNSFDSFDKAIQFLRKLVKAI